MLNLNKSKRPAKNRFNEFSLVGFTARCFVTAWLAACVILFIGIVQLIYYKPSNLSPVWSDMVIWALFAWLLPIIVVYISWLIFGMEIDE